jgi:hypothetical protein
VCFFTFDHRTRGGGRIGRPAFPAPSEGRVGSWQQNSGGLRRENAKVCLSSLRGAKRRSNPSFGTCCAMDCFAEPVIGRALRDPLARNDGIYVWRIGCLKIEFAFSPPSARISAWRGRDERSSLWGVGGGGSIGKFADSGIRGATPTLDPSPPLRGEGKQDCVKVVQQRPSTQVTRRMAPGLRRDDVERLGRVHKHHSSCPDLIRASIHLRKRLFRRGWIAGS